MQRPREEESTEGGVIGAFTGICFIVAMVLSVLH